MSLIHCTGCGETHDADRTCARPPLAAPTGSAGSTPLLGCPFCGGEPYEKQFPTLHVIGCKECGYSLAGKGIMADAATESCGSGLVKFVSGGTLEHQTHNRAKWNTRWSPNAQPLSRGSAEQKEETST